MVPFGKLAAAALALTAASSTLASAATYAFTTSGPSVASIDGGFFTITPGAVGILNASALITQNSNGLGVNGRPDTQPGVIDGNPIFSAEFLTVVFDWAVTLDSIMLGSLDSGLFGIGADQFDIALNDGLFQTYDAFSLPGGVFEIGQQVTSFTIRASGSFGLDGDDFTLRGFDVSPVPLPAAGLLMLAGLGALGAAARRRRALA